MSSNVGPFTWKFPTTHKHELTDTVSSEEEHFPKYDDDGKKYWSTNPWEEVVIHQSATGVASLEPLRVFEALEEAVKVAPRSIWLKKEYKDESVAGNEDAWQWRSWTRQEVLGHTHNVARALISLDLQPWQSVSICGFNSPEWFFADLGTIYAGGLVAGIYTTNNAGQCKYVANHSKTAVAIVENVHQMQKFVSVWDEIETLHTIVVWDHDLHSDDVAVLQRAANDSCDGDPNTRRRVMHWRDFIALGNGNDNEKSKEMLTEEMVRRVAAIKAGNACTLIYTSGTTGPPKAVMLSHDNITWSARAIFQTVQHVRHQGQHASVSYLPLSHVAAQVLDIHGPMAMMAHYRCTDFQIYFARPDALKGSLKTTIAECRPTIFFGVPRVWEKFSDAIRSKAKANPMPAAKKKLITFLKNAALKGFYNRQLQGSRKVPAGYWLATKLLFPKLRNALGFQRCQWFVTGAAPIQTKTLEFFASLGIDVMQVYGMSETSGAHTVGLPYHNQMDCAGVAINGVQTIIEHEPTRDKPGHGELCLRGRHIMMGYMYDEDKTANTIDDQGRLHSGDVGTTVHSVAAAADNYGGDYGELLFITGRIKELIITAGGENIAPVPIENYIKAKCSAISNAVLIGDQKKYLTMLLTLKLEQNKETMLFDDQLTAEAAQIDDECETVEDCRKSQKWKEYITRAIEEYNEDGDYCVSRAQKIQYYRLLDGDFGEETGELTSTMKLKRSVVVDKFTDVIETMYDNQQSVGSQAVKVSVS